MTAAVASWEIARRYVVEDLPAPLLFRVRLDQSYDGDPAGSGGVGISEDISRRRAAALQRCDFETVVGELWCDGRVPEWVNLAVVGRTGSSTIVEVVYCGRSTADEDRLYHLDEGRPPFHVLGPTLPVQYDGTRFSIHTRAECWDRDDLDIVTGASDRVWALNIMTGEFDGQALAAVPDLPNVEIIEHDACSIESADGLAAFARFPKLRILRLRLSEFGTFDIGPDSRLGALTHLRISNLPNRPWGRRAWPDSLPCLTGLDLEASNALWLDGRLPQSLQRLSLTAAHIIGPVQLPHRIGHLGVHLAHGTDEDIATLLDGPTEITSLSLRGTPVTDVVLPNLERYRFDRLDLVGTRVTTAALSDFRAGHPETGLYPRSGAQYPGAQARYLPEP